MPFAIQSIDLPTATQVRLVYFSPYTDLAHAIQLKTNLTAANWEDQPSVTFTALGGGLTQALFTKPSPDGAFFRVVALPKPAIFKENFETGAPGWVHGGKGDSWEVGRPVNGPGAAFEGTNVYATSLTGNIQPFSDCYLRSPTINLTGVPRATLKLQEWRNVDPDPTFHGTDCECPGCRHARRHYAALAASRRDSGLAAAHTAIACPGTRKECHS